MKKRKTRTARSSTADRGSPRPRKGVTRRKPGAKRTASATSRRPIAVAGVGASAGGLEAFTQLLRGLPPKPGMALVLVQHLSPTHESALPELLSKVTKLPVHVASHGAAIVANHVYVVPPNAELTIVDGCLRLSPRPSDRTQYTPIDVFFRSLAEWGQARALGVLLSGTSSDGVAGLREIRANGGTVLVQDPESAGQDVMPRAAISAGVADLVLPPRQLAAALVRLVSNPLLSSREMAPTLVEVANFAEPQLRRIFMLLRRTSGVDFSHYKEPTIRRRLHRRLLLHKLTDVDQYIKLLEDDAAEVQNLYQDLLIQVTRFFREPDSYVALAEKVFPRLTDGRRSDVPIRIWIPGCSTGEEAYSVAMALLEYLGDRAGATPIQVFATDVSDRAIERARAGIYPESIVEDVSAQRLRRFFVKIDGAYQITKAVRDLCVFAHQDLTRDPPFSKLDLIVCRNVLIYLDPELHKKLLLLFHYALKSPGYLMLGRAESAGPQSDLFALFEKKHRIFLRKPSLGRKDMDFSAVSAGVLKNPVERKPAGSPHDATDVQSEATRILISRYAPPGVIVDGDLRIVQTRGQTGAFLELAPGEPTLNLFKMLREGLLYGVRAALNEARKAGQVARKAGIKIRSEGHLHNVDVEVIPLGTTLPAERHYLVLFNRSDGEPGRADKTAPRPTAAAGGKGSRRGKPADKHARAALAAQDDMRIGELQQELAASREYLQSIIQDLEATNEELQSANEEILSSNEELQSTNEELDTAKEELQSTNEEINTVNEELQSTNDELSRANDDLINLLAGVQIAIVFVTNDLRIRRFTPLAEKSLNMIASDVGRPIGNIRPNIDCPDLEALIKDAIDNVTVKEREVQDREGNWMLLRIRPYKSVENRIDGAVIVVLDIDALRKHEQRSLQAQGLVAAIADTLDRPLVVVDSDLRVAATNQAFTRQFGLASGDPGARTLMEIVGGQWDVAELQAHLAEATAEPETPKPLEVVRDFPRVGRRRMLLNVRRVDGAGRVPPLTVLTFEEAQGG